MHIRVFTKSLANNHMCIIYVCIMYMSVCKYATKKPNGAKNYLTGRGAF